ncbi:uncharacterized protein LOC128388207 isoform X1 [Panonychus citri]|uniref:uncharacterized protein LOC128388207 isoform X1 n=1 Tax=Panonychus citri TaxID=50023 RepID=UPI00230786E6|nr:uncharacterized protein LOC128388207 isoform X1 [Panonychus citri]
MELGDLPYDCLSCIFDRIPDLKSLLDMSTVCKEWNILAKQRLKKIRHLHVERDIDSDLAASPNHLYTNDVALMERVNVAQMFPNLKFFTKDYTLEDICTCKMLVNVLSTSTPLIGLICESPCLAGDSMMIGFCCHVDIDDIVKHCGSLEYLDSLYRPFLGSYFLKFKFGQNIKYFEGSIEGYDDDEEDKDYDFMFKEIYLLCYYLKQMPNLEVLRLKEPPIEPRLWPLPKNMNLKQIEFENISTKTLAFQFLSRFPNLRSVSFSIRPVRDEDEIFEVSNTYPNIQDCAFNIEGIYQDLPVGSLKLIKSIMVKFPNCTNLRIYLLRNIAITNEDLIEIIKMLPHLTLLVLDIKNWGDANTIETIDKFCQSIGRRISFYLLSDDRIWNRTTWTGSYTRYTLNEDVANHLKTDNKFIRSFFRC